MPKSKVYVTRVIPEVGSNIVKENCDAVIWEEPGPPPKNVLLQQVAGAEGILCMLSDKMDAEIMDTAGPQLKVISNYAVGGDNIDMPAATERGIVVGNTPGVLTDATADIAFALMIGVARRLGEGRDYVKDGKWKTWSPTTLLGLDLTWKTVGIVGLGEIGKAFARRCLGFDMKVIYYDHKNREELGGEVGAEMAGSLEELLKQSDFVSLHCPLTEKTKGLIGAAEFDAMKNTAVLVNTSRGPVVDTDALFDALSTGKIAYAGLDVTDPEPLPADHKLLTLPNCFVIPHLGSASIETRDRMAAMAAKNLLAGLVGDLPPTCVNPEALEKK